MSATSEFLARLLPPLEPFAVWVCGACETKNVEIRAVCRKCGEPRPAPASSRPPNR